jgi:hypothetical protein
LLALPLLSLSAEIIELIGVFTKESTVKPENIQVPSNVLVYSILSFLPIFSNFLIDNLFHLRSCDTRTPNLCAMTDKLSPALMR